MKTKITLLLVGLLIVVGIQARVFFVPKKSGSLSFDIIEKTVSVPTVLPINECANWYVDFSQPKRTVIYSDKVISMGKYGGFACLDYKTLKFDESFTNKLNSDFYTNIACYNDTLFAEKFDEIFYWSKKNNTWVKYDNRLPVKFFDIIYQDDRYIFYPIDGGEWGSRLFIYDKIKRVTKGLTTGCCANAIVKTGGKYLNSSVTRHMIGFTELFTLDNIDVMPILVDHSKDLSIDKLEDYWSGVIKIDESDKSAYYTLNESPETGTIIIASTFLFKNEVYHLINHSDIFNPDSYMDLSKNENGKIVQKDSITTNYSIKYTNSYNRDYVFNCYEGYLMLQKGRFVSVKFESNASYKMKENYVIESGSFKSVPIFTLFDKKINQESIVEEKLLWDSRGIDYQINNDAVIHTEYRDKYDHKIFINYKGQEKRLKFDNSNNIVRYCFKNEGTDFIYFYCLGNVNHKYGLIELTDLERFVNLYSR